MGILDYTFPPIDNLAYYWWHKWLYSRLNEKAEEYGLLPLGAVFHAVQDVTQPYHTMGILLSGHGPYEDWLSNVLDPTLSKLNNPKDPPTEILLNFKDVEIERDFLVRVRKRIGEIYRKVIVPNKNVLHIRKLVHYIYDEIYLRGQIGAKLSEEDPATFIASGGVDLDIEAAFMKEKAIPLAVAASVVIMLEASKDLQDLRPYETELGLELSDFEHGASVPPLSSAQEEGLPGGLVAFEGEPAWACASESTAAKNALTDFYADKLTGREIVRLLYTEKVRCDFQEIGMPTDEPLLESLGRLEADRMEAGLLFLEHGNVAQMEKELACANALASPFLAPENGDLFAARCDGTLDSDFDGVPDQVDECATSIKLIEEGYTVDAKGCVFTHEAKPKAEVQSFILGTVKK